MHETNKDICLAFLEVYWKEIVLQPLIAFNQHLIIAVADTSGLTALGNSFLLGRLMDLHYGFPTPTHPTVR
jgi:hypothetical protein